MANNPKFLKKLLTTASTLAVIAGAADSALAAANRATFANNATFSTGANLHRDGGVANVPFATGSTLQISGAHDIVADSAVNILALDVNNNAGRTLTMTENLSLGSVVSTGGAQTIGVVINANDKVLTLTGTAGVNMLDANGGNNNRFVAAASTYTALGNIDFANKNNAGLTVQDAAGTAITLAKATVANAANATLNVNTDLTVNSNTFGNIGTTNIGTKANASTYTISTNNGATALNTVNFRHADSKLVLDTTNAGAAATFTLNQNLGADDNVGIVALKTGGANTLTVAKAANQTIGVDATHRVKQVTTEGASAITVNNAVFTKSIAIGSTGGVTFAEAVTGGVDSTMKFNAVDSVTFNQNSQVETIDFNNQAATTKVAAGKTLTANFISTGAANGTLQFLGAGELVGTANGIAMLKAGAAAGDVRLSGEHTITEIQTVAGGGTIKLADGFKLTGAINSTGGDNATKILLEGDATITGTVGANTAVDSIKFALDEKTLTAGGNISTAKGIDFNGLAKATVKLANDANYTITGPIVTGANGGGIIDASALVGGGRILTLNDQVGDPAVAAQALKEVDITNGATLVLANASNIASIKVGNNETATTKLTGAVNYRIAVTNTKAGAGVVEVNGNNVTLVAGSVLGSKELPIKSLNFAANNKATIADGVNLYTTDGIKNTVGADNRGTLEFAGASIVKGNVGATGSALAGINITGANKTVTFLDDVVLAAVANIQVSDKAIVEFTGNVTTGDIKGAAAPNQGIVRFVNTEAKKLTGTVGTGNAIEQLVIAGSDLEITGATVAAKAISFEKDSALSLTNAAVAFAGGANTKVTTTAQGTGTLKVNNALTLGSGNAEVSFGTDAKDAPKALHLLGDKVVTVAANYKMLSNITTETADKVTVTFAGVGEVAGLGAEEKELLAVNFAAGDAVVNGNAYSKTFTLGGAKATFGGVVSGTALAFSAAAAAEEVVIKDGGSLLVDNVTTAAAGKGKVTFAGNATVTSTIGAAGAALEALNLSDVAGKVVSFSEDIYATTTTVGKSTFKAADDITVHGAFNTTASTIDLGANTVKIDGTMTQEGALALSTEFNGSEGGSLVITGPASKLDLTKATAAAMTVNVDTSLLPTEETEFEVLVLDNKAVAVGKKLSEIAVTANPGGQPNRFVTWSATATDTAITVTGTPHVTTIEDVKAAGGSTNALAVAEALQEAEGGDALRYVTALGAMTQAQSSESMERTAQIQTSGTAVAGAASMAIGSVANRIADVTSNASTSGIGKDGVSSGEGDEAKFGAWLNPFFGQANQKLRKGTAGYNAKSAGATVGIDTKASEDLTVGLAATFIKTDVKHKNMKAGDKTKADTMLFSLYAHQAINDHWFVQGIASFGSSNIKNKQKRILEVGKSQTATGKYDAMTYSGEVLGGYNYKVATNAVVTPMAGLRYGKFNESGYTETGLTYANQTVSKKATDKIEGILGARVAMAAADMGGMEFTPEAHAFVNYDFKGKSPKLDARLNGLAKPITTKAAKPARAFYNLGLGFTAKSGMMEYGAGYDAHLANKYVGHQGSLKVRANF